MRWCKSEKDLKYWYPKKCDGHFLNGVFNNPRERKDPFTDNYIVEKSIIEELVSRGYDIESVRFEITLKE